MGNNQRIPGYMDKNAFLLLFCGLSALYWELLLIRWLGTCIRAIAYYSNFVLIAAFFGLGTGALIARYPVRLYRFIFPAVSIAILLGVYLSGFLHANFRTPDEYIWIGAPFGIDLFGNIKMLPTIFVVSITYVVVVLIFIIFGQWLGFLFKTHKPLWAYSVEIAGSVLGILLFALVSLKGLSPIAWFVIGFVLLLMIMERKIINYIVALICCVVVIVVAAPFVEQFKWSPYYRIFVQPLTSVFDKTIKKPFDFNKTIGYTLTVNNDYHQMILDLSETSSEEHAFQNCWRKLYDFPFADMRGVPDGPILIVGAGTGNDVSAALRNTDREVYAVEIDPTIIQLGKQLHFEKPYDNPRVNLVVDDARAFFHKTNQKFAMVIFGFLDSHTLLSSFSSVRLDNFVYTRESFEQVKRILLPGGKVQLTFASNRDWIHFRIFKMLNQVFDYETEGYRGSLYTRNSVSFVNRKKGPSVSGSEKNNKWQEHPIRVATDNWPFLYLRQPGIPGYYTVFICVALLLGFSSLLLLPKKERSIKFPYFFLGAAFFLLETSNVVSLSLLYGSTWFVNVMVFTGILLLVLAGNITSFLVRRPRMNLLMVLLTANLLLAYFTPTFSFFSIEASFLRFIAVTLVYLGPIYFAALIFATLIKNETSFYQAYGSNILGAVCGGVYEYCSLILGFKALLIVALFFYIIVYVLLVTSSKSKIISGGSSFPGIETHG